MGYTRIVQFGDITELYQYEKNFVYSPRPPLSKIQKRRIAEIRKKYKPLDRSARSIQRSRANFFRMVHHNNTLASSIDFFTITFSYDLSYSKATRYIAHFFERLKKADSNCNSLSYISVSEKTKKNRIHFHLLVYNLPTYLSLTERETRFIQRQFRRGYLDVRNTTYRTTGLAGYMAKYMAKSLADPNNENKRGYNCSRNIEKIRSFGSNSLLEQIEEFVDLNTMQINSTYDTIYLGRCDYKKFKT